MKSTKERAVIFGEYIVATGATVRETAAKFDISKSTVHKDVSEKLRKIDPQLYKGVKKVLGYNLSQRHIRGGEATKAKYESLKPKK